MFPIAEIADKMISTSQLGIGALVIGAIGIAIVGQNRPLSYCAYALALIWAMFASSEIRNPVVRSTIVQELGQAEVETIGGLALAPVCLMICVHVWRRTVQVRHGSRVEL